MKKKFDYYRIPDTFRPPTKGRPGIGNLYTYARGDGFKTNALNGVAPASKGGVTTCDLTVNGETIQTAAYCSHSDNFCYARGRDISLGRAMKLYEQETT